MDERLITELTVRELKELLRHTIIETIAEMMEIDPEEEVEVEAQIVYEAELTEILRNEMRAAGKGGDFALSAPPEMDD